MVRASYRVAIIITKKQVGREERDRVASGLRMGRARKFFLQHLPTARRARGWGTWVAQ